LAAPSSQLFPYTTLFRSLFYTNDEGTYMVKLREKHASAMQEFESLDDREKIVQAFRANTVQIGNGRLQVPMIAGITQPFNWWNVDRKSTRLNSSHQIISY